MPENSHRSMFHVSDTYSNTKPMFLAIDRSCTDVKRAACKVQNDWQVDLKRGVSTRPPPFKCILTRHLKLLLKDYFILKDSECELISLKNWGTFFSCVNCKRQNRNAIMRDWGRRKDDWRWWIVRSFVTDNDWSFKIWKL